jgi:hypothetical protein
MKNEILSKFMLVQVMTDEGLLKKFKLDNSYEKKLKLVEKQYDRIMVGLSRLDEADNLDDLQAVADRLVEIVEIDLPEAQGQFIRAFVNALYTNVKLPESREED